MATFNEFWSNKAENGMRGDAQDTREGLAGDHGLQRGICRADARPNCKQARPPREAHG